MTRGRISGKPIAVIVLALASARCSGSISSPSVVGGDDTAVLIGAGDIAVCGAASSKATGALLNQQGGTVIAVGDLAYPGGKTEDFANCYDPTWGLSKERTRPAPGNHEYEAPDAAPYFAYFGSNAGQTGLGYYRYQRGRWDIFALNSNLDSARGSVQLDWLRRELATRPATCTLAYFHHPRFSSGPHGTTGVQPIVRDFWRALDDAGADVVVSAHDHMYERFAPQDANGRLDSDYGLREFVAGTGGAPLSGPVGRLPGSEVVITRFGLLRLTLQPSSYIWEFLSADDGSVLDSGTGRCHPGRP
jgi:acid phosphatase type 7